MSARCGNDNLEIVFTAVYRVGHWDDTFACIGLCFDQGFEMNWEAGLTVLSFLQLTGQWTAVQISSFRLPKLMKIYKYGPLCESFIFSQNWHQFYFFTGYDVTCNNTGDDS